MTRKRAKPRLVPLSPPQAANDNLPATPPDVPATPTPERLAIAGGHVVAIAGTVRLVDRAIDRLHQTGQLDPDRKRNDALHAAAEQYLADYYDAGLAPLGAVDYGRPMVDGVSPKTDSNYRSGARERWNRARAAMGRHGPAVDRVVLDNDTRPVWAGDMVAIRHGLELLARRYGLVK